MYQEFRKLALTDRPHPWIEGIDILLLYTAPQFYAFSLATYTLLPNKTFSKRIKGALYELAFLYSVVRKVAFKDLKLLTHTKLETSLLTLAHL